MTRMARLHLKGNGAASYNYKVFVLDENGKEILLPVTSIALKIEGDGLVLAQVTAFIEECDVRIFDSPEGQILFKRRRWHHDVAWRFVSWWRRLRAS